MKKKTIIYFAAMVLTIVGYLSGNLKNFPGLSDIFEQFDRPAVSVSAEQPYDIPELIINAAAGNISSGKYIMAEVIEITDGDTFDIIYKGEEYKVRLLDVDTPESVKSGVPVQEYSLEASEFVKSRILNKKVKLVFEKGVRDRYNRLLAHVLLEDGTYLNAALVANGYAAIEFYSPNTKLRDYFKKLLQQAIDNKAGMWGLPASRQPFVKGEDGLYVPRYLQKKAS